MSQKSELPTGVQPAGSTNELLGEQLNSTQDYTRFDSLLQPSLNPYIILNRAPIVRIIEAGRVLATIHILEVGHEQ